ncbi:MAG: hypothetical protein OIN66_06810 [Candidatus Methanoperedens sp.]|nr:hypothetical protein [Candidatus Methanoperedens sp.]
MRKNKSELYLVLFIIAVIAGTAFLYIQTQEKNASSIFPEKLGDMSLALYRDGDAAMTEVKSLHRGANVEIEKAFIANYRGSAGNKAKFWVSESKNSEEAASLLAAMNSRVGKTGMFSDSTPVNVEGITVYFVTGQPELGLYHYFYAKGNRVFWIQVDNADEAYRLSIVKESIKRI